MGKRANKESKKKKEVYMEVYTPDEGMIMYDVYPLLKSRNLESRELVIANYITSDFIGYVCCCMGVPEPEIEYISSASLKKVVAAKYSYRDRKVYVNKQFEGILEQKLHEIACILRLSWMEQADPSWMEGFKNRYEADPEEYYLQKPVIDAAAYAMNAMKFFFHEEYVPNYSEPVLKAIRKHKELIYREMFMEEVIESYV